MANFEKPAGASSARWSEGLNRQEIVIGEYDYIVLYGGDGSSRPLTVTANDSSIVTIEETDPVDGRHRAFKLSGIKLGNAMIEAKNASGAVWAFMQTEVKSWKPIARRGPLTGTNGRFPDKYLPALTRGINLAWNYDHRAQFRKEFANIIGKASMTASKSSQGRFINPDSFAMALNSITLNYADTTSNAMVKTEIAKEVPSDWIAGFTDPVNKRQVYIRSKRLEESDKLIGDTIVHEAEHVAGLPGDMMAEIASALFERQFGIRRYNL